MLIGIMCSVNFHLFCFMYVKQGYFLLFPLEANSCSDGSLIAAVLRAADGPRHRNFSQRAPSEEMLCQSCFHHQRTFFGENVVQDGQKQVGK